MNHYVRGGAGTWRVVTRRRHRVRTRLASMRAWATTCCLLLVARGHDVGARYPPPAHDDVPETFSTSVDYKADFCDIAEKVLRATSEDHTGPEALKDALRGRTISTVWPSADSHFPPGLVRYDSTGAIAGGVMAELFDELSVRAGFEWQSTYGVANTDEEVYPSHRNKTWNDLVLWTTRTYGEHGIRLLAPPRRCCSSSSTSPPQDSSTVGK